MSENLQDKLISGYNYEEYDISYPVIITRWKIMQVNGLDKRYLQVYFQKISDAVKAFKFNVKCYSDFGEVENLTNISLQEIDKKDLEFSKVVPLKSEVNKVEVNIIQCLSLGGSAIEKQHKTIVVNTFKLFNEEDKEAGKRLLPSAKGYPIDNVSHWYCACGALRNAKTDCCERCQRSKQEIFLRITPENLQEKQVEIKQNQHKKAILSGITLWTVILTFFTWGFYIMYQVRAADLWYSWYFDFWDTTLGVIAFNLFFIISFIAPICLYIINFIGNRFLIYPNRILPDNKMVQKICEWFSNDIKFKKVEIIVNIICLSINVVNCLYGVWFNCFSTCYIPILLNLPLFIAYLIYDRFFVKNSSKGNKGNE